MKWLPIFPVSAVTAVVAVGSLAAQTAVMDADRLNVIMVGKIDAGDGQVITLAELHLGSAVVANIRVEPRESSPLAPLPVSEIWRSVVWTVTGARSVDDGEVVAECELRDGAELVGRLTVGPRDHEQYKALSALPQETYAAAVNCFRGQVRAYAIRRVAASEKSGYPVIVRVTFPDAVIESGGSFGIPSIR